MGMIAVIFAIMFLSALVVIIVVLAKRRDQGKGITNTSNFNDDTNNTLYYGDRFNNSSSGESNIDSHKHHAHARHDIEDHHSQSDSTHTHGHDHGSSYDDSGSSSDSGGDSGGGDGGGD